MFPEAWGDGFFHNCVSLTFTMLRAARGGTETHLEGGHGGSLLPGALPPSLDLGWRAAWETERLGS